MMISSTPSTSKSRFSDDTIKTVDITAAYDIPASSQGLPGNVEKKYDPATPAGMKQAQSFRNAFGYAGPCPGTEHTYEFALYALDVDALPGATMASTRAQVEALAKAHQLGVARLTGKYKKL